MNKKENKKQIEQYEHTGQERTNNPHVGLVTPTSDPDTGIKKQYQYDPHLDPQLIWAGKAEHTSFEVPTVSLHVHERIDPKTIIDKVSKEHDDGGQLSLFAEKKPLREAIDFYKHKEGWTNRLIAGDSLLVMNSLLEKEGMAGKVQMVYFDPPYGIKYGSNFQPFVNKRDVKDGNDEDLSAEPEMIKAFRDTWELGIHSYLTYLRDRLLLARELLSDSGSVFVQISDENIHHVKEILDEVYGVNNYCSIIVFRKTGAASSNLTAITTDYLLWYAKDKTKIKYNQLYFDKIPGQEGAKEYKRLELPDSSERPLTKDELLYTERIPANAKVFATWPLNSPGFSEENSQDLELNHEGKKYVLKCGNNSHWKVGVEGTKKLWEIGRLLRTEGIRIYKKYLDDFPYSPINSLWIDTRGETDMSYVVQTSELVIQRCILMTTEPGDLVFDPTCGSGTTAAVAENWGRRWITCDTSRVAITLTKQRIMTSYFDYYELKHPNEGIGSGLNYLTAENKLMSTVAKGITGPLVNLYDKPNKIDNKCRITGPFTVEAVPAPYAKSFDDMENDTSTGSVSGASDTSIARTGETLRQSEWRDELLKSGVRAKGGQMIHFTRVEPVGGTKFIQAEAETKEDTPKKVLVVFGPEHAPLEQRMVENAWQEARALKPDMLLFCAFQFDEEAAKDIDELTPAIAGMQLLKAQMNADLLTDDLRKKRSSNESFWLVGQPDVKVHKLDGGKVQVEVMGFDYYNPKTGNVESGGKKNIAMWMLDTDYDNRSLFPSQVFFPMAGDGDGWDKLAKNLKAEIDEEKIEAFKGTISLEFEPGSSIAVKIIDDRGIESLRVIKM